MTRFTSVSLNNVYTHSRADSSPWEESAAKGDLDTARRKSEILGSAVRSRIGRRQWPWG